ncbi:hypothetical protein CU254_17010 [Amycolatopsis sp. AA4]|uniref:hypothetical protein n=1 Tax=Actinomycetes TaxID=1760 RepID=UPI0001B53A73|nr:MULTISPECIES: hypothetical protein [Actinomycetes]ATY11973.1 hypothetical protein CU254_17010 [Amycolatopsis sp. AA4]EFL07672.1 predicted protein [Streptomyces sp. AA4]
MAIAEPPGPGFNFGAAGSLFFGQCAAGAGLLVAMTAALAWLRATRSDWPPPAERKRLTAAAVVLCAIGALVLGVGPLFFDGPPGSGFASDIPVFVVGLCVSGAGVLTGLAPALRWWSTAPRYSPRA